MSLVTFLIGPVVGGVIGGFTNRVAIRMLFRPYEAKHIGPIHIPFTPGIIPKEKPRLATAIGQTVSQHLLSSEILTSTLLSDEMCQKLSAAVNTLQARLMAEEATLETYLLQYLDPEELEHVAAQLQDDIAAAAYAKLADKALGQKVAAMAVDQVVERLSEGFLGGLKAGVVGLLRESIEHKLADIINEMMHNNAHQMVSDLLSTESQRLLHTPVCDLCRGREELFAQLKTIALKAYDTLVRNSLPKMLDTLNIQQIIENRINEMDMAETEDLIVSILDKELKALVWFGVLLGFLLGFVTNII